MSITPEQRQRWREDAHHAPIPHHGRILALLDELDASEAEADEWKRAADVNLYRKLAKRAEGERDQARLQMARFPDEKALREQAEAALGRVRALADEMDEIDGEPWASLGGVSLGGAIRYALLGGGDGLTAVEVTAGVRAQIAAAQAEALREAADEMPFGQSHAAHLLRARADRIGGDA